MGECEDCKNGIHKHMDAMKEPWYNGLERHRQLDAIDCKNDCDDGQCICHLWKIEYHKQIKMVR